MVLGLGNGKDRVARSEWPMPEHDSAFYRLPINRYIKIVEGQDKWK